MRLRIFLLCLMILISLPNFMTMKSTPMNLKLDSNLNNNWIMQYNTSLSLIDQNTVKLNFIVNITYLQNLNIARWKVGNSPLFIYSNNLSWVPYTASQITQTNVYQPMGSYISYYSITFNKSNSIGFNSKCIYNDFLMNINQSDIYNIKFQPNPNFDSFVGTLDIQLDPQINVTVAPIFWQSSGSLQVIQFSDSTSTNSTNSLTVSSSGKTYINDISTIPIDLTMPLIAAVIIGFATIEKRRMH